jgi:hypothetical protein
MVLLSEWIYTGISLLVACLRPARAFVVIVFLLKKIASQFFDSLMGRPFQSFGLLADVR